MNTIKLVVLNENIFGYIFPEQPNRVHILHASILKGAISQDGSSTYIKPSDTIRAVNKADFDSFNIYFPQYLSADYTWDKPLTVESISNAIKDSFNDYFYLNPEKLSIVERATKLGYIQRLSHTQAEWTEQGLKKAQIEL